MNGDIESIGRSYEEFYSQRSRDRVYPTEFVVRTFLSRYPELIFDKPRPKDAVLEMGFGDGRNTKFLCEQGFAVSGVELTEKIIELTRARLVANGFDVNFQVGRNGAIPFDDDKFRCLLAVHSCYYVDPGQSFLDNLSEYSRVLAADGWLVASVPSIDCYIFDGAEKLSDGSYVIKNDPYRNRIGYRLQGFSCREHIEDVFSDYFCSFSVGYANNNFFGIRENAYWVVCKKSKKPRNFYSQT